MAWTSSSRPTRVVHCCTTRHRPLAPASSSPSSSPTSPSSSTQTWATHSMSSTNRSSARPRKASQASSSPCVSYPSMPSRPASRLAAPLSSLPPPSTPPFTSSTPRAFPGSTAALFASTPSSSPPSTTRPSQTTGPPLTSRSTSPSSSLSSSKLFRHSSSMALGTTQLLPDDAISEVFTWLPTKEVARSHLVCRSFRANTSNVFFYLAQLRHACSDSGIIVQHCDSSFQLFFLDSSGVSQDLLAGASHKIVASANGLVFY